nr:hypothetical protein [Tanacetum cinerariifolium]
RTKFFQPIGEERIAKVEWVCVLGCDLDLDLNTTQGASTFEEVKHMQNMPGEPHWTIMKTILKYLRNIKDMILVYGGNPKAKLRVDCYCNVGFETNRDGIKSLTGYVSVLNKGAVDWESSKQSTTAMSAT